MDSSLENTVLRCAQLAEELAEDYEDLVMENRELRNTVERLERERREFGRRLENVSGKIREHMRTRA